MRLLDDEIDLRTLSPLTLAFIGDAVYDLLVREMLVCRGNRPVGVMNNEKIELVRCETQARYAKALFDSLTEEEQSVLKRGQNANAMTVPKHASRIDYHFATGFEALFGYLYLKGESERIRELFKLAVAAEDK